MSKQITNFQTLKLRNSLPAAYAFISELTIRFDRATEQSTVNFTVDVYEDRDAYDAKYPPLERIALWLGEILVPEDQVSGQTLVQLQTLPQILANPTKLNSFTDLKDIIYQELDRHPRFAGGIDVP
jgi:hypothetical protein